MPYFVIAIFGLLCSVLGLSIALLQLYRHRPSAPVLLLTSLPGLVGCAYHTWRLWP